MSSRAPAKPCVRATLLLCFQERILAGANPTRQARAAHGSRSHRTGEGTGHEQTHATVTRAARRALAHDVWPSLAAGSPPKSPLGHQCPGAALWLAGQLALDGDAASNLWLL